MTDSYRIFHLDQALLNRALTRAQSLPVFNGSHRGFQANVVGCIGEIVFEGFMAFHNVPLIDERYDTRHDYLVGDRMVRLEVKTKERKYWPRPDFDNSVPLYNHAHQRPNYYAFMSLLSDRNADQNDISRFTHAFFVGAISIEQLERQGKVWNKGQTDPSNGTTFWTDCINVSMRELISCEDLLFLL